MSEVVDLDARRPHEAFWARCFGCAHRWKAVIPAGIVALLECPNCREMHGKAERVPMRCVECGNATLTLRATDELRATEIAFLGCGACGLEDRSEQFYGHPTRGLLSYGEWMDFIENDDGDAA